MHRLVRNLFRCGDLDLIEVLARQLQPRGGKKVIADISYFKNRSNFIQL